MQARKIKYDVIGLTETRIHRPLNATYNAGEGLFLGACNRRGVGGVGVQHENGREHRFLRSANNTPNRTLAGQEMWFKTTVTIFVAYARTSGYEKIKSKCSI